MYNLSGFDHGALEDDPNIPVTLTDFQIRSA